jgi:cation:H+ antiporter
MLNYLLLLIGFIMLIKGADIFVDGAGGIARKFGIPSIIVGMTIVAMGTSAPELSVSIQSALSGMNQMSIANVVGSNLFNLLVVLGCCALVTKLKIVNFKDVWTTLIISSLLVLLVIDGQLGRIDGAILLLAFAGFIIKMIKQNRESDDSKEENSDSIPKLMFKIMAGLLCVVYGGDLVVDSASAIAMSLGMSEALVGLTIVAVGTSLPELVTSLVATKKGENDIAVGNVIGSNIFNILLILGTTSVINPLNVPINTLINIIILFFVTVLFILMTYKKKEVNKLVGIICVVMYIVIMCVLANIM